MSNKLFKNDKNYILKKVQNESKKSLLNNLISQSVRKYELESNPLNLIDSTRLKLDASKANKIDSLIFFYKKISAIYRYSYGEVQLSFLWDGSSHEEYYKNRWISFFRTETKRMTENLFFLKTILSLTVLNKHDLENSELQYKLSTFIRKKYNIQVFKRKGIVLHSK